MCFHAVYHMMETGWVKVSSTDVMELHYKYKEEAMAAAVAASATEAAVRSYTAADS